MRARLRQALLYLAWTAALSFGLAEAGARFWLTRIASPEEFGRYASLAQLRARSEERGESLSRFERHLYAGFVGTPEYRKGPNRHDQWGFRGDPFPRPKPEGEFRIVCLGGSTTYTSTVDDHRKSYPTRLQSILRARGYTNVRVINAGLPGYSSYETLINLQLRVLDVEPNMIIVYHAVNDVLGRLIWPPSAYRGDNSGAKTPAPGLDAPLPLLERSTAIRIALTRFGYTESPGAQERTFVRQGPHFHGFTMMHQHRRGVYPRGIFQEIAPSRMLKENPPIYFERNLEHIVLIAKHHGIQPVLATFASVAKGTGVAASDAIRAGIAESNDVIARVAEAQGVPLFDFAATYPADPTLFRGGVHMNTRGVERKAELFANFLQEAALLSKPAPASRRH